MAAFMLTTRMIPAIVICPARLRLIAASCRARKQRYVSKAALSPMAMGETITSPPSMPSTSQAIRSLRRASSRSRRVRCGLEPLELANWRHWLANDLFRLFEVSTVPPDATKTLCTGHWQLSSGTQPHSYPTITRKDKARVSLYMVDDEIAIHRVWT